MQARIIMDFNPHFPRRKWLPVNTPWRVDYPDFNPHFPRRKWRIPAQDTTYSDIFQSTLPAKEVTWFLFVLFSMGAFQSTLPAKEVTEGTKNNKRIRKFQSTLPAKEVTALFCCDWWEWLISIHTSREGSDFMTGMESAHQMISIHTSREGSDT